MSAELATTGPDHPQASTPRATARAATPRPRYTSASGRPASAAPTSGSRSSASGDTAATWTRSQVGGALADGAAEPQAVVGADGGVVVQHRDAPVPRRQQMVHQDVRLLLERADLIVEHAVAARDRPARVVDARHAGGVGQLAHDEAVVADRRPDDGHRSGVDERAELGHHRLGRPAGQSVRVAQHQLDRCTEARLGIDLVETEPHAPGEVLAAVALVEIEEQADSHLSCGVPHDRRILT